MTVNPSDQLIVGTTITGFSVMGVYVKDHNEMQPQGIEITETRAWDAVGASVPISLDEGTNNDQPAPTIGTVMSSVPNDEVAIEGEFTFSDEGAAEYNIEFYVWGSDNFSDEPVFVGAVLGAETDSNGDITGTHDSLTGEFYNDGEGTFVSHAVGTFRIDTESEAFPVGSYITATATRVRTTEVTNETSEMSAPAEILVLADIAGDDGIVNQADAAKLLQNMGTPSGALLLDGDLSGDGAVSLVDLAILQSNLTDEEEELQAPGGGGGEFSIASLTALSPSELAYRIRRSPNFEQMREIILDLVKEDSSLSSSTLDTVWSVYGAA